MVKQIFKGKDGKTYMFDTETKAAEEVEVEEEAETTPVEEQENTGEVSDEVLEQAAKTVSAELGIDKLMAEIAGLKKSLAPKEEKKVNEKKNALIDLEALMEKSVDEMTAKEKTVGFFQAMLQNNKTVLKALSEGKQMICSL